MIYFGTSPFAFTYFLMGVAATLLVLTVVAIIWYQSMIRKMEEELDEEQKGERDDGCENT